MIDLLLKLGGTQGALFAILLLAKRPVRKSNVTLAVLMFFIGIASLFVAFESLDLYLKFPILIRLNWGLPLLFGPLFYIYILYLVKPGYRLKPNDLWHFAPYIINLIILMPFLASSSEYKIQMLDYFTAIPTKGNDKYLPYFYLVQLFTGLQTIYYFTHAKRDLKNYQKDLKNEFSDIEKRKKDWLQFILIGFGVVFFINLLIVLLNTQDIYPALNYTPYFYLALFILVYLVSYKVLADSNITSWDNVPVQTEVVSIDFGGLPGNISAYMEENRPYLDQKLTASQLAKDLDLSRHQLSEVLSGHFNTNFYDFINAYRVEEFKKLLQQENSSHLSLLGIAYDSGFNSKTTFNTVFKSLAGMTPSQYKKHLESKKN